MANDRGIPKANAFCLSTVSSDGGPSSRMLLISQLLPNAITFCTDARSPKIKDLSFNPKASALLYWHQISRQIRIEGTVQLLDDIFADADFESKTREQQLLICLCAQSEQIATHRNLQERMTLGASTFPTDEAVRRPPYWRAYSLSVDHIECFVGGKNRLNRRTHFSKKSNGRWGVARLAP